MASYNLQISKKENLQVLQEWQISKIISKTTIVFCITITQLKIAIMIVRVDIFKNHHLWAMEEEVGYLSLVKNSMRKSEMNM